MVPGIVPPDPEALLPPILACLPTAFISTRPPPALLPLLSPILRQRLQYSANAEASSSSESWLPYLCWDSGLGKNLVDIVSDSDAFEPHPTSGQIEKGDVKPVEYCRSDEETLHARIGVPDVQLEFIYLWHIVEEGAEDANTWLIAEVKPYNSPDSRTWHDSIVAAENAAEQTRSLDSGHQNASSEPRAMVNTFEDNADDEDDYWAQYDKTPARTPGHNRTPTTIEPSKRGRTTSEAEYFDRYAEVQPEMDNDDPSQEREAPGQSTLNGDTLASDGRSESRVLQAVPQALTDQRADPEIRTQEDGHAGPHNPETFDRSDSMALTATRQHVSSNIKSLFKLCRNLGMDRTDFEDLVTTELQALSILEDS